MSARRSSIGPPPGNSGSGDGDDDELMSEATPLRSASRRRSSIGTPLTRLRQLAGAIHKPATPLRRPSVGAASARRTPASQGPTPALNRPGRPVPRLTKPTTPHAIRALKVRKAAAASTPGRAERRRSGKQQRETPRDILRMLSKVENKRAKTPQQSSQTPPAAARRSSGSRPSRTRTTIDFGESDSEDEPPPELTMPINDDDSDDDSFEAPPRLSQNYDDEEGTQVSIEAPRRDFAGLGQRLSEGIRMSDRFGDVEDADEAARRAAAEGGDDTIGMEGFVGGDDDLGDETGDLRGLLDGAGRESLAREPSFGVDDAENSFAFRLPESLMDDGEAEGARSDESDPEPLPQDFDEPGNVAMHTGKPSAKKSKALKQSRYGIPYPSLPPGVVKKLTAAALKSSGKSKTRVNAAILAAVMQASDWFFEQLGEDLEAYANHAKRKTIDESDVVTLMKRQRLITKNTTPFSLAEKKLPRELLQDLRMVKPPKLRKTATTPRRRLEAITEESE